MKNGQVQTNDYGVNVLVYTEDSTNTHWSNLNRDVKCERLTKEEIIKAYKKHIQEPTIGQMKDALKKQSGFAISNCVSDNHSHNDLFTFKEYK